MRESASGVQHGVWLWEQGVVDVLVEQWERLRMGGFAVRPKRAST